MVAQIKTEEFSNPVWHYFVVIVLFPCLVLLSGLRALPGKFLNLITSPNGMYVIGILILARVI